MSGIRGEMRLIGKVLDSLKDGLTVISKKHTFNSRLQWFISLCVFSVKFWTNLGLKAVVYEAEMCT